MKALEDSGIDYILGVKIRNVKEVYDDILLRGGRGRDMGTFVFPQTAHKFFLTASTGEHARG